MRANKLITFSFVAVFVFLCSFAFASPANLVQSVTYGTETITMRLKLQKLRGSHFEVKVQNSTGGYDNFTPVAERSYIGTVDEYPDAVACGILQDDGVFRGAVYFDRGVQWYTLGNSVFRTLALKYKNFSDFKLSSAPTVSAGQAGKKMLAYDVAVDAKYTYYKGPGKESVAKTFELIEYNLCLTRTLYMQDALLRPYLARVIIRADKTKDPYKSATNGPDFLTKVLLEWKNNQNDAKRALVAGLSVHLVRVGLAKMNSVGHYTGVSVNDGGPDGLFYFVWRHEMGHNWGCAHNVGGNPEGTGIMGGNRPARFSGPEVYCILQSRKLSYTRPALRDEGSYTDVEIPPYASLDAAVFKQGKDVNINIDVLANDHDANGQTLSILSFDNLSNQGATITKQGQNLIYTLPKGSYTGADYFKYKIKDTAGKTATGVVIVDVQEPNNLHLYLPLDETKGRTARDKSSYQVPTTLANTSFSTSSVSGKFGRALELNGSHNYLIANGISVNSNTVTLTAWIKRNGQQNQGASIIFSGQDQGYGIYFGPSNELRFTWGGGQNDWGSGLTPPNNVWTFVALVIEPTKATLYMNSGSGFQSKTQTNLNLEKGIYGSVYIGAGYLFNEGYFKGVIDDVRIYGETASLSYLQTIYENLKAQKPKPFSGATKVTSAKLTWMSLASNHRIYLGTDEAKVNVATIDSLEYQGESTSCLWTPILKPGTTYFWRVDTIDNQGSTTKGDVWSFTTATDVIEGGLIAHWKMDTGSGTSAIDSSGNSNHGIISGASWQSGYLGKGLAFNLQQGHYDDHIKAGTGPSLSGETNFTLSAWIKTTYEYGDQIIIQQAYGTDSSFRGQYRLRVNQENQTDGIAKGSVNFTLYGINSTGNFNFNTTTAVNDGQWHFITAVRDGKNAYIYIDGVLKASTTGTTIPCLDPKLSVSIGKDLKLNRYSFTGSIDEVKIYDIAKNSQQVQNDYYRYIGIELWKKNHFGENANNPFIAGFDADPDGDGISNLLEYAFGLDPQSKNRSTQVQSERDATTFSLIYPRNKGAKDVNFIIEKSNDLSIESWSPVEVTETILSTINGVEKVKATIPLNANEKRSFFRLHVEGK